MDDFLVYLQNIGLLNLIDLVVCLIIFGIALAFFIYKRNVKVFVLIFMVMIAYVIASIINVRSENSALYVSRVVLKYLSLFIMVCLVVVYQSDIKTFTQRIASVKSSNLFLEGFGSDDELMQATAELITATQNMAKQDIGALIIITPTSVDSHILDSGTVLNANLTAPLIESIFHDKTPLHDGAVIVKGNKLIAAGCFLPLTQDVNLPQDLGTRHRAAIGITEESDVLAIVVSEETGIISIAKHGKLLRYMTIDKLKEEIKDVYGSSPVIGEYKKGKHKRPF